MYKFFEATDQKITVRDSIQGEQLGEYYGAALASGDINNDGLDDLIVGAPFHKVDSYNEGKVYIYLGSEKVILLLKDYKNITNFLLQRKSYKSP